MTTPLDKPFRRAARLQRAGWIAGFTWLLLVAILSLLPGSDQPAPFPHADKLVHFFMYAFPAARFAMLRKDSGLIIILLLTAYGSCLEVAQEFVPRRGFDWLDILANMSGAAIGTVIIRSFRNSFSWLQARTKNS